MSVNYLKCHWCDTNATRSHRLDTGELVGVCLSHLAGMTPQEVWDGDPRHPDEKGPRPGPAAPRQMMWAIAANIETRGEQGYTSCRQLPTFYLHPNVQGTLTAERAEKVARDILNPYDDPEITLHITAEEVLV